MNAPPFPPNPSFGQFFGNWVWSGSRWVCTNTNGVRIVVQTFRASAPYTPSPGLISAVVECIGGGGGGGEAVGVLASTIVSGGGGGSGGFSRVALASGLVLGGVNVIIGQGGGPQGPGGATSFGAFCVANGGLGALGNNGLGVFGQGGPGAPPGVGDVAFAGATGAAGVTVPVQNGPIDTIGISALGGWIFGGTTQTSAGVGGSVPGGSGAPNSGAGGSGAVVNQMVSPVDDPNGTGGTGGSGLCVVTEYCWADAVDDGCGCGPTGGARVAITGPQGSWSGPGGWDND
jgi:hypothetical protein